MGVLVPGTKFEGCRIEETIGRGGMGVVYRARQLDLDRDVAIKVITPERVEEERTRRRFLSEARAAAAVEHPNVLPVYGAGVKDGQAYLLMRYVHGDDLRAHVRMAGTPSPERAAAIAVALGDALDAIHAAGYVHRDVKPANVLLDESGHVYVTDFGLAKQALATAGLTESDRWVGTLDFAAPEQIRGGKVDARADVYALGGVLHFMLTGAVPFDRESDEAKLWAHLCDSPPRPSSLRADLPAALDPVVQRAMAKQPDDRHPSAGDLGRAARAAAGGAEGGPERSVARGAAAPGGAPSLPGLLCGSETLATPRAGAGTGRRRRGAIAGAVLALAAAAASAAVVAIRSDGGGETDRAAVSPAPSVVGEAAPRTPRVGETLEHVGFRPRGIAVLDGDVWVISAARAQVARIGADTMRRHGTQPRIGRGAVSIAAYRGAVWVAISRQGRVIELDSETGLVRRRLPVPVMPILVAADGGGLWVAGHRERGGPDVLFHYDLAGHLLRRTDVPHDITALTVGGGSAWIAHAGVPRILGYDGKLRVRHHAWIQQDARGLAYGGGRVWASLPDADSIARYDPPTRLLVGTRAGSSPAGLAVAGGRVFVASYTDHTVVVVDPETMKTIGDPLHVPFNPWAVEAGAGHVWVSGLGSNTLSRIDY